MWGLVLILFHLIRKQLKILSCIFQHMFPISAAKQDPEFDKSTDVYPWCLYNVLFHFTRWLKCSFKYPFFLMLTKTQGYKLRKISKERQAPFCLNCLPRLLEPCMQRKLIWQTLHWAFMGLCAESIMAHATCAQRPLDGRSITSGNTTYCTVNLLRVTDLLKRQWESHSNKLFQTTL